MHLCLDFFFLCIFLYFFLLERVKYKTDWQLEPLSFKKWSRSYWVSTVWSSIIEKQLWKAEGFAHTFRANVFSVLVSKDSKHSPSAVCSLVSLGRVSVRTPLPEVELWQRGSLKASPSDGHPGSQFELICLAGLCTWYLRRKHYPFEEFTVRSLTLIRASKYFAVTFPPTLVVLCNLFSLLPRK